MNSECLVLIETIDLKNINLFDRQEAFLKRG